MNQRQLIGARARDAPPHAQGDEALLTAMRDFELAYDAYAEFQRTMERYWCLRWLMQERRRARRRQRSCARTWCASTELPLVARVPSLPALAPGTQVEVAISRIDLLELTFHCEFAGIRNPAALAPTGSYFV